VLITLERISLSLREAKENIMGYVIVIFGSLIALNFGFGVKVSDISYSAWEDKPTVDVQTLNEASSVIENNE